MGQLAGACFRLPVKFAEHVTLSTSSADEEKISGFDTVKFDNLKIEQVLILISCSLKLVWSDRLLLKRLSL